MRYARALIAAAVVIGVSAIGPSAWAANAHAAHACQKRGYEQLTRQDGTSFRNAGECTSYVARGGVLRPRQTWNGVVTATSEPGPAPFSTVLSFEGTGFTPDADVVIVLASPPGGDAFAKLLAKTDGNGRVAVTSQPSCASVPAPMTVTVIELADQTRTASTTLASVQCSPEPSWVSG